MKIKLILTLIVSYFISHTIFADTDCFVIGFHQPNTHIYQGPTFCNQVKLSDITVHGPLEVNHAEILGHISVSGPIEALHATLGDIQINQQFTSQKIVLKNHSKVQGNIIFLGFPGVVIKSNDSIVVGKIMNGSLKNGAKASRS